jgi:hypothetical protein
VIREKEAVRFCQRLLRCGLVAVAMVVILAAVAQTAVSPSEQSANGKSATPPDLTGVYQMVPSSATLPRGLRNTGSTEGISLQPSAVTTEKAADLKQDGAKICVPIGPFRMMAWAGNKIELLSAPGRIMMLFEDIALGHERIFYLDRSHDPKLLPLWNGDSVGHWEGDTLIVDTTNFNGNTWLNGDGAPHSDALHLVERYRLVLDRKYLEVDVTAADPKVLTKPYTYTRYYEKVNTEIQEDFCTDDLINRED